MNCRRPCGTGSTGDAPNSRIQVTRTPAAETVSVCLQLVMWRSAIHDTTTVRAVAFRYEFCQLRPVGRRLPSCLTHAQRRDPAGDRDKIQSSHLAARRGQRRRRSRSSCSPRRPQLCGRTAAACYPAPESPAELDSDAPAPSNVRCRCCGSCPCDDALRSARIANRFTR